MKRLYVSICKRWGPRGLTFSAYAWAISQERGQNFLRNRIDGLWLFLFSVHNHCQASYQKETRA